MQAQYILSSPKQQHISKNLVMGCEPKKRRRNLTKTKKRVYSKKIENHAHEGDQISNQFNNQNNSKRKQRMKWDDEKHKRFLSAVQLVGLGTIYLFYFNLCFIFFLNFFFFAFSENYMIFRSLRFNSFYIIFFLRSRA